MSRNVSSRGVLAVMTVSLPSSVISNESAAASCAAMNTHPSRTVQKRKVCSASLRFNGLFRISTTRLFSRLWPFAEVFTGRMNVAV